MAIDTFEIVIHGDDNLKSTFTMDEGDFERMIRPIFEGFKSDGPYAPSIEITNLSQAERERLKREQERKEFEKKKAEERARMELESQQKFAEMCSHLGMWKLGDNPDIRKALEVFRKKYGMTEELPEQTIDDIERQAVKDIAYLKGRIEGIKAAEEESKTLQQKLIDHIKDCTYGYDHDDDTYSIKCPNCQFAFASDHEIGMHTCPKCGYKFGVAKIKN